MNIAHDAPKRPALRYYGGKWKLAPWIISHFPAHKNYVEPCGGAASVLLQKPRSPLETYNDLDGNVVNFFRVLRDKPEELIHKIRLTPWARAEYDIAREFTQYGDEIERARRYFLRLWASMHGGTGRDTSITFRVTKHADHRTPNAGMELFNLDFLYRTADRFRGVQIENDSALMVIDRYDNADTLHYFDPPYLTATRAHKGDTYGVEASGTPFHIEAADLLRNAQGYVVISGYACDLYTELYEDYGWHRVDREAQTNSGGKRIESLWLSPRTWAALNEEMSGLPLFDKVNT